MQLVDRQPVLWDKIKGENQNYKLCWHSHLFLQDYPGIDYKYPLMFSLNSNQ